MLPFILPVMQLKSCISYFKQGNKVYINVVFNDKEQIIKYKDEMLRINPQITEMVAKYAGCSVEEVERCVEKYFSPSSPSTPSLNELIKLKAKEITK